MARSKEAEALKCLEEILKDNKVNDRVSKHLITGLQMESIPDFVKFVPAATYEVAWENVLKAIKDPPLGDALGIQCSRVRQAWEAATDAKSNADSSKGALSDADWEAPLPEHTIKDLREAWLRRYADHQWGIRLQPADSLIARLWREYHKGQPTIMDVAKCKALVHTCMPQELEEFNLGVVLFSVGKQQVLVIQTVIHYYFGLRLLGQATAYACNYEVKSIKDPSKMVIMAPLDVNLQYADEALRIASLWTCDAETALKELRAKDVLTRSTMVVYVRQGWSQGEALKQAVIEHRVDWRSSPTGGSVVEDDLQTGQPGSKRPRNEGHKKKFAQHYQGKQICRAFNDGSNCKGKGKGKGCPRNHLHVCDIYLPDGKVCGSKNHNRSGHRS